MCSLLKDFCRLKSQMLDLQHDVYESPSSGEEGGRVNLEVDAITQSKQQRVLPGLCSTDLRRINAPA